MGKLSEVELAVAAVLGAADGAASGGGLLPRACAAAVSPRCALAVALSGAVFLSAIFWIPPFFRLRSVGFVSSDPRTLVAEVQASFMLQKPVTFLIDNIEILERDIYDEIGVPNSKVSIISIQTSDVRNFSSVVFGVLSTSNDVTISSPALSVMRSSLIELVLQQLNLSLTPIFGQPSSFELLKFPGGITVVPLQSAFIGEGTHVLFNFTLNNTIYGLLSNIDELKSQLKFGLDLRLNENIYVQLTNENGSTINPPATVQASVLSNENNNLLPDRLRQLAEFISGHDTKNLGLNHSVFGRVRSVQLSSYLSDTILSPALAPSPSPSLSPYTSPASAPVVCHGPSSHRTDLYISRAPSSSTKRHRHFPCHRYNGHSPTEAPSVGSHCHSKSPHYYVKGRPCAPFPDNYPSISPAQPPNGRPGIHPDMRYSQLWSYPRAGPASQLAPKLSSSVKDSIIPLQDKKTEITVLSQSSSLRHSGVPPQLLKFLPLLVIVAMAFLC